jgi:protein-S-isoprenylcysteine O-methyltransferase Ste14
MLPLIYTRPADTGIFLAACCIWNVPELIGSRKQMARVSRKEASLQDRGSMVMLIGFQWTGLALNFILGWLFPAAAIQGPRMALFLLGVLLMLPGVALRWYAIWTLGNSFTRDVAVAPDQNVVQNGPYRFIRHPSYSGTILTMLGVGLAVTNWASLLVLLLFVLAGHLYRVRIEEQALVRTLGQPYIAYMQRTKRFIPLVF